MSSLGRTFYKKEDKIIQLISITAYGKRKILLRWCCRILLSTEFLTMLNNLSCRSNEPEKTPHWLSTVTIDNMLLFIWEVYTLLCSRHKWNYCRFECDTLYSDLFLLMEERTASIFGVKEFSLKMEVERSIETSVEIYRTIVTTTRTLTLTKYWNLLYPLDRKR
jgi:hypothetical protein